MNMDEASFEKEQRPRTMPSRYAGYSRDPEPSMPFESFI